MNKMCCFHELQDLLVRSMKWGNEMIVNMDHSPIPYQAPETRSPKSQVIGETEELSKRIVQSFSELTRT